MAKDLRALSEDKIQLNQAVCSLQQLKDAILDECAEAKGEIARINEQIKGYGEGAEGVEEMHKKLMQINEKFGDLKQSAKDFIDTAPLPPESGASNESPNSVPASTDNM